MDPNANLDEQLELVKQIQALLYRIPDGRTPSPLHSEQLMAFAEVLAERVEALDHWLTGGGFLPSRWNEPRMERIR